MAKNDEPKVLEQPADLQGSLPGQETPPLMALTSEDLRRSAEQGMFLREHAKRDVLRQKAGDVEVVAVVGFTIYDDVLHEEGRVIRPNDELTISAYDLDKAYHGKVRLKELPPSPGAPAPNNGVTVTQG